MTRSTCLTELDIARLTSGGASADEINQWLRHAQDCGRCGTALETSNSSDPLLAAIRDAAPLVAATTDDAELSTRLHQLLALPSCSDSPTGIEGDDLAFLEPPQAPDELGRIGDYRILAVVGQGATSVVFRAEDLRLNRLVAIKLLRESEMRDERRRLRFEQEAKALARLRHPHIVQALEVGRLRSRPYLALQYVSGGTLAERLLEGALPADIAASCVATLARALHYAHQQGIAHRDLKPANILVDVAVEHREPSNASPPIDPATLRIADFGLARRMDEIGGTRSGELLGTPSYMAPESTDGRHPREIDAVRADLFSLGAIFYQMLVGHPPFEGAGVAEILERVRTADPPPPRRRAPRVPRDLETICLKCLAKSPASRYESAAALADDLDRYSQCRPILARPASRAERIGKWMSRRPAFATAITIGIVAATLSAFGVLRYERRLRDALGAARAHADAAQQAEQQAAQNRDLAMTAYRSARDALRDVLQIGADPTFAGAPQLHELRRAQTERALTFLEQMTARNAEAPETRYDVARARFDAARLREFLGQLALAQAGYRQAAHDFARLSADFPADRAFVIEHGRALTRLATTYSIPAELSLAIESGEEALRVYEQARRDRALDDELLGHVATAHHALASVFFQAQASAIGERREEYWKRAETHYLRTHSDTLRLVAAAPDDPRLQRELAAVEVNLSVLYQAKYATRRYDCRRFHDRALATYATVVNASPADPLPVCELALLRLNWAYVRNSEGELAVALDDLALNVLDLRKVLEREPRMAQAREMLYRTHGVRANLLDGARRHQESSDAWDEVVELSSDEQRPLNRLFRAMAMARTKRHGEAVAESDSLARDAVIANNPTYLWNLARVGSLALDSARRVSVPPNPSQRPAADVYRESCVVHLQRAKAVAPPDLWRELVASFAADPDFAAAREFDELRAIVRADRASTPESSREK